MNNYPEIYSIVTIITIAALFLAMIVSFIVIDKKFALKRN